LDNNTVGGAVMLLSMNL